MREALRIGVVALLAFTVLCGLAYPAIVYGLGVAFSQRAAELVGREFTQPGQFWSRRSHVGYDATTSSGANVGPSDAHGRPNPALVEPTRARIAQLRAAERAAGVRDDRPIPADLVTASASGLDPHISPAAAAYQVPRVAAVRGLAIEQVMALVERYTEPRTLGILGEPRVDVVLLNRALDAAHPPAR